MWSRCSLAALIALVGCRPETPPKDTPYKLAAESFAISYCELAFSDGCSVPEDCGVPGGFDDQADCEARLVPFLRACFVPDDEADPVIESLNACETTIDAASCDDALCNGGPLDSEPCVGTFTVLSEYCTFDVL